MTNKIRIGPAGWAYKDWEGIVYPQKPGAKFDPLEYLAQFFDTIEINSSFYRPFSISTAEAWVRRVGGAPDFMFTAKLNRVFTHERGKATAADEKQVREGMDALQSAGKLGALLLQFPWSFKNTDDDRVYLAKLLEKFSEYPLVLEIRHSSWNNPQIYEWLEQLGVGICNVDQPLFAKSIKPAGLATSQIGYVRLHGRNYQDWFREKAPRDDRYNYLYSLDELEPWIARIKQIAAKTKESYVITNNHFRGQAVVNALEIKATIEEERVFAPMPLIEKYPELAESVVPKPAQVEPGLFD
ncbi:MAG TPA: DUF72 domain-containing protein [Pyrinomonadaceae bacterium]|jgi:uncharacterized protein YecE (DUF72 family)|nr:DUF72 domain-containing protein [Pyrinomonadaceae bacterium]